MEWRLTTRVFDYIAVDEVGIVDVEVKKTDGKAEVCIGVEDESPERGRWRRGHAQTLSKEVERLEYVTEIGNGQKTRIDWVGEVCKGMAFGRGCNTAGKQIERSSFYVIFPASPQKRVKNQLL